MTEQPTLVDHNSENLDCFALVEVFGHTKVAGRVTTRKVGVNVMFQVDVPKGDKDEFSHSQLFSPAAVFSINPTTEEWCRRWAKAAKDYNHSPLPYIPEAPKQVAAGGWEGDDQPTED